MNLSARQGPAKQGGLSFIAFIFGAIFVVLASIGGMRLIPAYMENAHIKSLFITIANDPDMKKGNKNDILMSFNKRATIDNITAIKADDIDIIKDGDRLILSASYTYKVALAGNASLCLDFNPSSAQ
jgi:Domain of unknown function (DUF4845)